MFGQFGGGEGEEGFLRLRGAELERFTEELGFEDVVAAEARGLDGGEVTMPCWEGVLGEPPECGGVESQRGVGGGGGGCRREGGGGEVGGEGGKGAGERLRGVGRI